MRHFLAAALSISLLALGVCEPSVEGRLVASSGGEHSDAACRRRARTAAVPVPAITPDAQEEDLPARRPGTDDEPKRFQAPSARARGSGPTSRSMRSRCCWITGALLIWPRARSSILRAFTFSPCRSLATCERTPRPVFGRSSCRRQGVQNHAHPGERQQPDAFAFRERRSTSSWPRGSLRTYASATRSTCRGEIYTRLDRGCFVRWLAGWPGGRPPSWAALTVAPRVASGGAQSSDSAACGCAA